MTSLSANQVSNSKISELEQSIQTTFGILDSNELQAVANMFQIKSIPKGEILLHTNKKCNHMHFILSGYIRVFVETAAKEVTQWIASKGYFLTDLSSFIFDKPARWTLQTLTDVELFSIAKSDYDSIKDIIPTWPDIERLFILHCFTTMEDRVFSHLSMSAEERYQHFFTHNKELFNQVPLQYIASMLGMTAETFSRIRKKHLI